MVAPELHQIFLAGCTGVGAKARECHLNRPEILSEKVHHSTCLAWRSRRCLAVASSRHSIGAATPSCGGMNLDSRRKVWLLKLAAETTWCPNCHIGMPDRSANPRQFTGSYDRSRCKHCSAQLQDEVELRGPGSRKRGISCSSRDIKNLHPWVRLQPVYEYQANGTMIEATASVVVGKTVNKGLVRFLWSSAVEILTTAQLPEGRSTTMAYSVSAVIRTFSGLAPV